MTNTLKIQRKSLVYGVHNVLVSAEYGGYGFHSVRYFLKYDCSSEGISRSLFNLGAHDDGRCHQGFNDHEMYLTGGINVVKRIQLP